ncbi:hypothetical protein ACFQZC_25655 [Streptacidiphilus monticola]
MSPEAVFRALVRRWYVLALAALLAAVGAYHVVRPTPQYMSSTVLVLKPRPPGTSRTSSPTCRPAWRRCPTRWWSSWSRRPVGPSWRRPGCTAPTCSRRATAARR